MVGDEHWGEYARHGMGAVKDQDWAKIHNLRGVDYWTFSATPRGIWPEAISKASMLPSRAFSGGTSHPVPVLGLGK